MMIIYNQFGLFTMPVAKIKILEKFEIIFERKIYIYIILIHLLALSFIHHLIKIYLENMNAVLWIRESLGSYKSSIMFNGTYAISS